MFWQIKKIWKVTGKLFSYKGLKRSLCSLYFCNLVSLLISVLLAQFEKDFVNNLILKQNYIKLWEISLFILTGNLISFIIKNFSISLSSSIGLKWENQVKKEMIVKLFDTPPDLVSDINLDDFKTRIDTDSSLLVQLYLNILTIAVSTIISIVAYVGLALYVEVRLSIIVIISLLIFEFTGIKVSRGLDAQNKIIRERNNTVNENMYSSLTNYKFIKMKLQTRQVFDSFVNGQKSIQEANFDWMFSYIKIIIFQLLKTEFIQKIFIYLISSIFVLNGSVSVGAVVLLLNYFNNITQNIKIISDIVIDTNSNSSSYKRCMDMIQKRFLINKGIELKGVESISIDELSVAYNKSQNILNKVTLRINTGDQLILLGDSGQGKTTLINCIAKLKKPDSGRIKINKTEIGEVSNYFQLFSFVLQDASLFNITLKENILLGKPNATTKEIDRVCDIVNLTSDFEQRKLDLNMIVGINGEKLSGGQRQKILLAKAILKESEILVFDEANSALDSQTEHKLNTYLINEDTRILIMVSHRKNTQDSFKTKYIIKNGKIEDTL